MNPVTKISRVLVGVDFDDASASALKMAGVLASAWDAEITVFHRSDCGRDPPAARRTALVAGLGRRGRRPHSPRPVLVVPAAAVVPDTRRATTILAAGGDGAAADAWVDVLRTTFGGNVVRQADIHQCEPNRVQNADLIVLSMAADVGAHAQFGAIVQVLKECVHPVLFVPSADGIFERSSS
jgi:hypothetical protein